MSRNSFTDMLDSEQKTAVESTAPHTLVVAGPGSGKTMVLTARYLRCLEEGHSPRELCAITFTNRAALNMRNRIARALGKPLDLPFIDTFHGLALKMLKNLKSFKLYGREDTIELLRGLGVKRPAGMAERLSLIKNMVIRELSEEDRETLTLYNRELERRGALDLDDLLIELACAVREGRCGVFSCVLVDEFQDINPLQAYLIGLFTERGSRLFAIGDPDQSIYGFRGANLEGFLRFTESYPSAEVVTLKRNYRSTELIVRASTSLIEHNRKRIAHPFEAVKKGGERIKHIRVRNEREEAEFVAREIESLMGGLSNLSSSHEHCGYTFSDFAILFRTRRQIPPFEEVFRVSSIPYHVVSLPEGMAGLAERIRAMKEFSRDGLLELVKDCGMAEYMQSLVLSLAEECATKEELAERLILMDTPDVAGIKAERVSLLTLHAVKGLEFRVVFVAGCDEGILPLRGEDIEEERRLFYVAITRATERLYLTGADRRRFCESSLKRSCFIEEIPRTLLEELKTGPRKRRPFQRGLFD